MQYFELYEKNSNPLRLAEEYQIDTPYYNPDGNEFTYRGREVFHLTKYSVLIEDATIVELNENALDLFWKLMKNKDK